MYAVFVNIRYYVRYLFCPSLSTRRLSSSSRSSSLLILLLSLFSSSSLWPTSATSACSPSPVSLCLADRQALGQLPFVVCVCSVSLWCVSLVCVVCVCGVWCVCVCYRPGQPLLGVYQLQVCVFQECVCLRVVGLQLREAVL